MLPEFRIIQMLVNPEGKRLLEARHPFCWRGDVDRRWLPCTTRGPHHRVLRNPEPGFNNQIAGRLLRIYCRAIYGHACSKRTCSAWTKESTKTYEALKKKQRSSSASWLLSRIPTWTMGYLLCYGAIPRLRKLHA